jgi:hypothetical protein
LPSSAITSGSAATPWPTGCGVLPAPEWTLRPNAKDDLRDQAIELRKGGCSVPAIATKLGVSKSTAYLWTRHMPLDPTPEEAKERRSRHMQHMRESRWGPHRRARDVERSATNAAERARVGALSAREVLLMGAAIYWCEGSKAKEWDPNRCRVTFINSDPALMLLFLRFIELLGEDRARLKYRISIHESADVNAAGRWWADVVDVPFERGSAVRRSRSTIRPPCGTTSAILIGDASSSMCRSRVDSIGGSKVS